MPRFPDRLFDRKTPPRSGSAAPGGAADHADGTFGAARPAYTSNPTHAAALPGLRMSLKLRIALITTALVAVFGTAIVLASLYYAYQDQRAALENQQDSVVRLTAGQLDAALEDRIQLLTHIAPQMAGMSSQPRAELEKFLQNRIPSPGSFDSLALTDAAGRVLNRGDTQLSIADRNYFREVARSRAPLVTGPLRGRHSGSMGVTVAVPIESPDKEFLGLLGGWLDLARPNFLVEIAHSTIGTTGFFCLVSSGAAPVYIQHPDPANVYQRALAVGDTCGVGGQRHLFEFLSPRQPVISRHLLRSSGWELIAVMPAQEAFGPLHTMQRRYVTLAAAALALVALLIWLTVRRLLAPLGQLRNVVNRSAADPAAYEQLPALQRNEIGDLARAFAKLMRNLTDQREDRDRIERRLRAVTDTLPALLAFVDADERYVFNNLAYERVFGLSPDALRGKTVREIIGETRYAVVYPHMQRALAGTESTFDVENHEPEFSCMETSLRPEWSGDGNRVLGVHIHVQDVTQRKLETTRLARLSRVDHLTQLLNRNAFESLLQDAMARCRAGNTLMALLYLDMDRFKAVNDFHGHVTGDLLLQAFGRRLQRSVRSADTVARLGGDEFAVILEDIGQPQAAERIATAILHSVGRRFFIDGVFADVDVSIGIALYNGSPLPEQALIRLADSMLYQAKAAGRGRFEIGPPELAGGPASDQAAQGNDDSLPGAA